MDSWNDCGFVQHVLTEPMKPFLLLIALIALGTHAPAQAPTKKAPPAKPKAPKAPLVLELAPGQTFKFDRKKGEIELRLPSGEVLRQKAPKGQPLKIKPPPKGAKGRVV